ncbi:class I SAM-dependent methyltransferase, partial [Kineococcus glutinatus]|uniref:class I SAM-dependent methyltransferase n=1 Tax=Kineococcus glutinatus TaxID=1070872 RepID=UPI0031EC85F5
RAVRPGGRVDAVDLSAPLLGVAAGRAAAEDLPLRTHVADVVAFGAPGSYDLAVCVMGIFFLPDVDAGGRHLLDVLRPGGRLCVSVWAEGAMVEAMRPLAEAVARVRGEEVAPAGSMGGLGTAEGLAGWARRLGAVDVAVTSHPLHVPLDGVLAGALVDGTAAQALLTGLDAPARAAVRAEVVARLGGARPVLTATSLVVTGRRP